MQYFLLQISVYAKSRDPVQKTRFQQIIETAIFGEFPALYRRDGGWDTIIEQQYQSPDKHHVSTIDPAIIDSRT
jgi:hypothetical protein